MFGNLPLFLRRPKGSAAAPDALTRLLGRSREIALVRVGRHYRRNVMTRGTQKPYAGQRQLYGPP